MADSDNSMIQLKKEFRTGVKWVDKFAGESEYESITSGRFTNEELETHAKTFGKDAFGGVAYSANFSVRQTTNPYWVTNVSAFAVLPENNGLRENIIGEYPVNDDEMMITSYTADTIERIPGICDIYLKVTGSDSPYQRKESFIFIQ